jgi:hypothetical protein
VYTLTIFEQHMDSASRPGTILIWPGVGIHLWVENHPRHVLLQQLLLTLPATADGTRTRLQVHLMVVDTQAHTYRGKVLIPCSEASA